MSCGEKTREYWQNISPEAKQAFSIKMSNSMKAYYADMSPEVRASRIRKGCQGNSKSAIERWRRMSAEDKRVMATKISNTLKVYHQNMTPEEKEVFAQKRRDALTLEVKTRIAQSVSDFLQSNPEAIENLRVKGGVAIRKYHDNKTPDEHERRAKNISKTLHRLYLALPDAEKTEFHLKLARSRSIRPTRPEKALGKLLSKLYPNEWVYNGDYSRNVIIGNRVPDFVNVNGRKVVIEVYGRYWHPPEDEPERIAHYAKFGFKCIVLWEDECYDRDKVLEKVRL